MSTTPAEQQRLANLTALAALKDVGWTLERDNEAGGTLVLRRAGVYIVGGFHAYEDKTRKDDPEASAVEVGVLVPALPVGDGKKVQGWVIEDDEGSFWDGVKYQDMLSDGAEVYTDAEKEQRETGVKVMPTNGTWVPVYAHEVDGCLTTEPCEGVDECQDCLDVRKSVGEDITEEVGT